MSVALIGSSGGGTATLGHTDPIQFIECIHQEILKIEGAKGLIAVLFVSLDGGKGMDTADPLRDHATLYTVDEKSQQVRVEKAGETLASVNARCRVLDDEVLAQAVREGRIQGLVCVSCHVELHAATLKAAAERGVPVTGSGGTSLSAAASRYGIRLVGNAGGSVATTTYTRAVSYTRALSQAWNKPYHAKIYQASPRWTSVLDACLPAFWTVCLTSRFLQTMLIPFLLHHQQPNAASWLQDTVLVQLQHTVLPTVCCVVMASTSQSRHQDSSTIIMAATVAAVLGCHSSVLAGLLAGVGVSLLSHWMLHACVRSNVPATMTNLLVAGGVGSVVGLAVLPLSPLLRRVTSLIRSWAVHAPMSGNIPGMGFLMGCLFCYGSKVGYYHKIGLPVILVEMEHGAPSLWGAIDEATLVLVSAGICAANLLVRPQESLCLRGLRINLLFGDFIEVAYPFMEESWMVNASGYLASGVSTELLATASKNVLSLAYLPLPISVWLANDRTQLSMAYASAWCIVFCGTILSNALGIGSTNKKNKDN